MIPYEQQKQNILLILNNYEKDFKKHYNASNSFLFVTEVYQFKINSEIKNFTLCLGNISKDFTINNLKNKTGLKEVVNFFYLDFNSIDTDKILDIHKYLMKRT